MIYGYNAYNGFVSYSYEIMSQLILPDELDFSTMSTTGFKKLRFRSRLYACKKKDVILMTKYKSATGTASQRPAMEH